jgi:hypothetical protein
VTGGLKVITAALFALPTSRDIGMGLGAIIIAVVSVTVLRRQEFPHSLPLGVFAALLVLAAATG